MTVQTPTLTDLPPVASVLTPRACKVLLRILLAAAKRQLESAS